MNNRPQLKQFKIIQALASLRITIACLFCTIVLVLIGTLEQTDSGVFAVQERYFRCWFVYWPIESLDLNLAIFPGAYSLSVIFLINLSAATISRFRFNRKGAGILLIHFSLAFLLLGELVTGLFSVESQITLELGEVTNYSQSPHAKELILVDTTDPEYDQIVSIPEKLLRSGKRYKIPHSPFTLQVRHVFPNAELSYRSEHDVGFTPLANRGIGGEIVVRPVAPSQQDHIVDFLTVSIALIDEQGRSLGTWLLSNGLSASQVFSFSGHHYELQIRRARHYEDHSIQLSEFIHEIHAGTNVPKSFCSKINLFNEKQEFDREISISMNQPLHYKGKTYYQASYGEGGNVSVLQVVENPGKWVPYISSSLVAIGLLMQFFSSLSQFRKKKG